MIELPAFQYVSSNFKYNVLLDDKRVEIKLVWNIRNECWFMTFTDTNGIVLQGIKVVENYPLLAQRNSYIDFNGDLFLLPTNLDATSVNYDNLGTDYKLTYLNETEVEEWAVLNGV